MLYSEYSLEELKFLTALCNAINFITLQLLEKGSKTTINIWVIYVKVSVQFKRGYTLHVKIHPTWWQTCPPCYTMNSRWTDPTTLNFVKQCKSVCERSNVIKMTWLMAKKQQLLHNEIAYDRGWNPHPQCVRIAFKASVMRRL